MSQKTQSGIQYAVGSDAPDLAAITQNLAASIEGKIIPSFANSAARAAAITAPVDGMITYQQDTRRYERYYTANGRISAGWSQFLSPKVVLNRTSTFGITSGGSPQAVSWNTPAVINPAGWSVAAAGVTMPAAGVIRVKFVGEFLPNATGRRFACILQNGNEASILPRFTVPSNTAANNTGLVLPGMPLTVAAGDVITVGVYQDSGAGLNLAANATMEVEYAL